jgi:hypothetical protein
MAHGAFQLMMTFIIGVIFAFVLTIPDRPGAPPPPAFLFFFIFAFMLVFQLLFIIPSFVAAFGLLKQKSWARVASIVAGILAAMNVPFGTAACVYSLWFFLGENWKEVYQPSRTAEQNPQLQQAIESRWTGFKTDEKGEVSFHHVDPPDWR